MSKDILSLSAKEAMDFLMKSEQYHSFELPEYFEFDKVLDFVKKKVGMCKHEECIEDVDVSSIADVNFEILLNKDGKYGVRPLTLVNPYLSNSTNSYVRLQNITYQNDKANNESPYDLPLCKLVMGEKIDLWDNSWLKPYLTKGFPTDSIVNKETLKKNDSVIMFRETRAYFEM